MTVIEMAPVARSSWIILEWVYQLFEGATEFGVAVAVFNMDTRQYRRMAVRMAWPPSSDRMNRARRHLWEWIGRLETETATGNPAGGAVGDDIIEGHEARIV